jgi:diguanylate cyclase (GGDEF)-like protein
LSRRGRLPQEVHADLVETLFGTVGSFLAGVVGGVLAAGVAWLLTREMLFLVCTLAVVAMGAFRVAVHVMHARADSQERRRDCARWERLYAIGAIGFMTTVGLTAAILFDQHRDRLTSLYAILIAVGTAGPLPARNSGRPFIVYGQVLGICLPLALVILARFDAWHWGLAVMLFLIVISVKSTTRFLNDIIVSALMNGREASIQRTRFGTALDSMSHGLCMGDAEGVITVVNQRLRDFFNLKGPAEGLTVRGLAEAIAEAARMSPTAAARFVRTWETHVAKRDASVFSDTIAGRIYDFRCEPMEGAAFVVVAEDVTEARIASREIERMAHFDSLTGLPNRMQFHAQLEDCFRTIAEGDPPVALLSVDLDQFKEVNDTRGHPVGDELLRHVARRLRQAVQGTDLVARFGGDEFQVLLMDAGDVEAAGRVSRRIIDTLSAPYSVDGAIINIGATIGVAMAPRDADNADDLLRCADMALYQAKAAGRGTWRAFEPDMDTSLRRKRQIERDLREALANGRLELHYQPVVDSRNGQIVACEALVRMRLPNGEMQPPGDFIPVAEETGLVVQLGDWVLRQACRDAATWPADVRVAVNFSAKQFVLRNDVVRDIREALASSGLEPHRLEVEITESTIIEAKDAEAKLREIAEAGVRIALDDFGTGYSSLSYLRKFPVDKIKIDRSFIVELLHAPGARAVVRAITQLAAALDMETTAEGVEDSGQVEVLREHGCTNVQGYYFSQPVPAHRVIPLIRASEAKRATAGRSAG